MKFYHQGNKNKSNNPGAFSGCLVLIGFGAIVYLITLLDSFEDVEEYLWQIILAIIMGASLLASVFAKRAKLFNYHITLENDFLKIGEISIPTQNLILDAYYSKDDVFTRYHLRDKEGKIAIYSVLQDDLLNYFTDNLSEQTQFLEETSHKYDGPYISVNSNKQSLLYNLETGKYTINSEKQTEISFLPEIYSYDGKYKLGKPLGSKLSKK